MAMSKPLGPGGVALLILLAAALPVRCALVGDLAAIPNPFSPNGDGTYDETSLSYTLTDSVWTVVSIEDSAGLTVRELWSGFQSAGPWSFVWDGRGTGGDVVDDATYTYAVTAGAERRTLSVVLDTSAPAITGLTVAPSRFTPDGDGVSDSVLVSFVADGVEPADLVTVGILDASDSLIVSLMSDTGVDTVSLSWDGTSGEGVVADTTYHVLVEALDSAGNASLEQSLIDLDTDPPSLGAAAVDSSGVVAVDTTSIELSGWVYDRAGVDSVEYSQDGGPWTRVALAPLDDVPGAFTWSFELACGACTLDVAEETAAVELRAYDGTLTADGDGHVNGTSTTPPILSFDTVFDVTEPLFFSSGVVDDDSIYEPGETITIQTSWDRDGYTIEAFFSQIDSEFDPADVVYEDFGNGDYEIEYTVSTENALTPVGPERVRIVASDYFHSVADSSVMVSVVEPTASPGGLSVDRNSFDPTEGEAVTIDPGDSSGDVEVEVFTLAGTLVASLDAGSGEAVTWDGTNGDGETVASGVYFLLIRLDGNEHVRKVAVVK